MKFDFILQSSLALNEIAIVKNDSKGHAMILHHETASYQNKKRKCSTDAYLLYLQDFFAVILFL